LIVVGPQANESLGSAGFSVSTVALPPGEATKAFRAAEPIYGKLILDGFNRSFVSEDEREVGRRAILNFGHTIGHAVEAATGYGPLNHGEAVVIGMRAAVEVPRRLGRCPPGDAGRALLLLSRFPRPPQVTSSARPRRARSSRARS
jgi:3-dehydroquinate synthetase